MVKDARWPALPLMIVRGVQLFFAILVMGMSGYLVSIDTWWGFSMALTAAVFTLVYAGANFVLLFMNLLLPLAVVIVDAAMTLFWMIALAGLGEVGVLQLPCSGFRDDLIIPCQCTKAAFGISFLAFLTFLGTLALASIILHRNRKDLGGTKYNSGMDPASSPLQPHAAVAMGDVPANAYYSEPKQGYAPIPQPTATPAYYDHQHPGVLPSAPAPQGYGMRQPSPDAAEMPSTTSAPPYMPRQGYGMRQPSPDAAEMPSTTSAPPYMPRQGYGMRQPSPDAAEMPVR